MVVGSIALTAACTEVRRTQPERTATEQLLISTAADEAIARLDIELPAGTRTFVDAEYFKAYDKGYAVSAIRAYLLERGARLVPKRTAADLIVEIRSGALSINRRKELLGVPSVPLPVPMTGNFQTPEIPVLKHHEQQGVAKIALTAYDKDTGQLWTNTGPVHGVAWVENWSVLGVGWRKNETLPDDDRAAASPE